MSGIAEGTRALTDADAALVQDEVLPFAEALTPAKLRVRVQQPQWSVHAGLDGRIHWITPTGHSYPEHQVDLRPGDLTRPRTDRDSAPGTPVDQPEHSDDPPPF